MRALAGLLLVALVVSGCTVEPPQVQGTLPERPGLGAPGGAPPLGLQPVNGANGTGGNASFDVPASWQLGQYWRYHARGSDGSVDVRDTRVVTAVQSDSYVVDTDDPGIALFDTQVDVSTIGAIRRSDLAGQQQGAKVEFFRFPLFVNETWSTPWDGTVQTILVTGFSTVTQGGRALQVAQLEAHEGAKLTAKYTYAPEAGWFGSLAFYRPDGNVDFTLELQQWGLSFKGAVVRVAVEQVYHDAGTQLQPQAAFTVPSGATYLDVRLHLTGDMVAGPLTFVAPDNTETTLGPQACPSNCSLFINTTFNATAGAWKVASGLLVQGTTNPATARLDILAITVNRIAIG